MEAMLEPVAEFIRNNSAWAGLVLGLFIMLESLVIVGALIPATPLLVLTGGLLATGVLDPVSVLIGCNIGAN
nr:DedA family protein [Phenylobacterium sp.]